jgi:DNA replication protein DnaC
MNNNRATLAKMREMKLYGMANAFETTLETGQSSKYTVDELLTHLIDSEWDDKNNRRRERLLKAAGFRYAASFAELDFTPNRNLDKNQMLRFSDSSWVMQHKDIVVTGATGSGKSFLGSALGHLACEHGYKVKYHQTSRLFAELKEKKSEGSYHKSLARILNTDLLILDDFGLSSFTNESRLALLDILEDRHGRKSTMFLSQLPVSSWHELIGDSTIADAIMDRIVYGSHRVELAGDKSLREKYNNS